MGGVGRPLHAEAAMTDTQTPDSPEYRSPEALRFEWGNWDKQEGGARYPSIPADDLHALGIALYRLLTWVERLLSKEPEARGEEDRKPETGERGCMQRAAVLPPP
jgi:hypothetical protein